MAAVSRDSLVYLVVLFIRIQINIVGTHELGFS